MRRPYRSASSPKMNAPIGRKANVSVIENATAASLLPNSFPIAVSVITTRKKSNASSIQPRKPARTAGRWLLVRGAVMGVKRYPSGASQPVVAHEPFGAVAIPEQLGAGQEKQPPTLIPQRRRGAVRAPENGQHRIAAT